MTAPVPDDHQQWPGGARARGTGPDLRGTATLPGALDAPGRAKMSAAVQRIAGNTRLSRMASVAAVQRQTPPTSPGGGGGPAPAGRVVYVDANVVIQVNRGNQPVANALRQIRAAGPDLRISPQQPAALVTQ